MKSLLIFVFAFAFAAALSHATVLMPPLTPIATHTAPQLQPPPQPPPSTIPCDFDSFEVTGCEDDEGSYCEPEGQKCTCKEGYPVRLLAYCLDMKQIGDDCYTSAQCKQTANAACFIFGKEYDNERISGGHNVGRQLSNWPTGTCRCNIGHVYDNATNTCVKRAVGGWCNEDWDCIKSTFNSQCSRPQLTCECTWGYMYDAKTDSCVVPKLFGAKCASDADCAPENLVCSQPARCVCPAGFHYDVLHPGCKPNDDSSCQYGYKWDEEWGRCIPARSSSAAASHFNLNTRPKHVEPTTTVLQEDDSSPMQTLLIFVLPNLIGLGLIVRYCYFRKRDGDGADEFEDLERGMVRPTLSAFDKHRNHQIMRAYNAGHRPSNCSNHSCSAVQPAAEETDNAKRSEEQQPLNEENKCPEAKVEQNEPVVAVDSGKCEEKVDEPTTGVSPEATATSQVEVVEPAEAAAPLNDGDVAV